jgi:hypothetical protein
MRSQRLPANGTASIFHLSKSNDLGDMDRAGEAAIVRLALRRSTARAVEAARSSPAPQEPCTSRACASRLPSTAELFERNTLVSWGWLRLSHRAYLVVWSEAAAKHATADDHGFDLANNSGIAAPGACVSGQRRRLRKTAGELNAPRRNER